LAILIGKKNCNAEAIDSSVPCASVVAAQELRAAVKGTVLVLRQAVVPVAELTPVNVEPSVEGQATENNGLKSITEKTRSFFPQKACTRGKNSA